MCINNIDVSPKVWATGWFCCIYQEILSVVHVALQRFGASSAIFSSPEPKAQKVSHAPASVGRPSVVHNFKDLLV